jgi:predicted PurR-regulated permease PerM
MQRLQRAAARVAAAAREQGTPAATEGPDLLRIVAVVAVVALGILALRELRDVLLPVVLSVLLFYALDPFVDVLSRRLPRLLATTLVLAALVGCVGAVTFALSDQALQLVNELPDAVRELRATLTSQRTQNGTLRQMHEAAQEIERTAREVAGPPPGTRSVAVVQPALNVGEYVWWGSLGTLAAIGQAMVVLFLTFFLIQSNDLYRHKIVRLVGPRLTDKKVVLQALASIEEQIKQFLQVQIFTCLLVGVTTWLALWALGVNHAAVWGVIAGVLNLIPFFGPLVVTLGLMVVAWVQFGNVWTVSIVASTALAITTIEGFLIAPILLGRAASMNHVAVFVSLLFWSWVWGVFGALLAVPIMMALKVTCDRIERLHPVGEFLGE